VLGVGTVPRAAAATPEVQAFVERVGAAAVHLLREGIPDATSRRVEIARLLNDAFDTPALARLSLGRFWRVATPQQQGEFQELFEAFLINLYSNSLERDADDPPVVTGFAIDRVRAEPQQQYAVLTHFERPAGPPFRVEWRLQGEGPGLRVVDVAVEGISMIVLFRQMMASAVHEGGGDVEGLLKRLRQMVGAPPAATLPAEAKQ
jgi:phospholipid transport system substrate-binding protein